MSMSTRSVVDISRACGDNEYKSRNLILMITIWVLSIMLIIFYDINRDSHEYNLCYLIANIFLSIGCLSCTPYYIIKLSKESIKSLGIICIFVSCILNALGTVINIDGLSTDIEYTFKVLARDIFLVFISSIIIIGLVSKEFHLLLKVKIGVYCLACGMSSLSFIIYLGLTNDYTNINNEIMFIGFSLILFTCIGIVATIYIFKKHLLYCHAYIIVIILLLFGPALLIASHIYVYKNSNNNDDTLVININQTYFVLWLIVLFILGNDVRLYSLKFARKSFINNYSNNIITHHDPHTIVSELDYPNDNDYQEFNAEQRFRYEYSEI